MGDLQVFIAALLVSAALLNAIANWLQVPYPIVLVLGGLLLGLAPEVPEIELNPDLVLLLFLPPLLYSAAFFVDLPALHRDLRPISLLAIGLVLATMLVVALVAHEVFGLPVAMAFVLGAIVAPTDPVAATAILRRLGVPRRTVNVLEGESLVNDATALVAYKIALAVAVGGSISATDAGFRFVWSVAGGIAIGLIAGYLIVKIRSRVDDPITEVTISLVSGYAAFLPADAIDASGVLAVVAAGTYIGWNSSRLVAPETRLQAYALWGVLIFLLNATLFILIGLQLPLIADGIRESGLSAGTAAGYAALTCAVVIAVRFAWIFGATAIIRAVDRRPSQRERRASAASRVVFGWAGMRGAVSLAAALALPLQTDAGAALPGRDLIRFLTFAVILVTLVGQGLTLPALIRRLGLHEEEGVEEREEVSARIAVAAAALERLDELAGEDWTRDDTIERVRAQYEFRQHRFQLRTEEEEDEDGIEDRSLAYQRLMHEVYTVQRDALIALRDDGEISSEVMRRVERELDLEESRLEI
ncbi:MAG TPA: Na+/H+ antiporter [Solirubrobacterales bacterium]|nr:Na+/H+ antiporter [Solirubrobacterales bacterium]